MFAVCSAELLSPTRGGRWFPSVLDKVSDTGERGDRKKVT